MKRIEHHIESGMPVAAPMLQSAASH